MGSTKAHPVQSHHRLKYLHQVIKWQPYTVVCGYDLEELAEIGLPQSGVL